MVGAIILLIFSLGTIIRAQEPRVFIDTHEHIESIAQANSLYEANEELGIQKTVLIPSPIETLTLNGSKSFTGYRENIDAIFAISEMYPDHFIPFCTISPMDPDAAKYLKECIERGGKGLKLYNGHSYYYEIFKLPLHSPRMLSIYSYAERNKIPLLYHVNITKYGDELEEVFSKFPNLVVSVPHYMVSSIGLSKVADLLDRYPNLYTDISFGSPEFMAAGFRRISKDVPKFANFINQYSDRILFGADMVLTGAEYKNQTYMKDVLTCYKDLLESRQFACPYVSDYYQEALDDQKKRYTNCEPKEGAYCRSLEPKIATIQERLDQTIELNGLGLSDPVLRKIYEPNHARFLDANQ